MITIEYLRSFKLGDYAVFDLFAAFLGVYLLAPALSRLFQVVHLSIPRRSWLYLTLPLGILTHVLISQDTPMTRYFLDPSGHYLLKLFILALLVLGLHGIKVLT